MAFDWVEGVWTDIGGGIDPSLESFDLGNYWGADEQTTGSVTSGDLLSFLSDFPEYAGSLSGSVLSSLGSSGLSALKSMLSGGGGSTAAGIAGALLGSLAGNASWAQPNIQKTGYQGGIPSYAAVREAVPQTYDPTRRPGSRGQEYFTQQQFVSPTDTATAQATASQQATEASARNKAREAEYKAAQTQNYAMGGLASFAKGTYLNGSTDGMTDEIPATIDGKQPAKLSHGEFVLPADVVSHLGNGNSEAGAKRLYDMMDRIRKARTGTKQQGKQINPNKFMPG